MLDCLFFKNGMILGSIRFLLALSVVFSHMSYNSGHVLVGGKVAVQLFYVISGFLIMHVLQTNKAYGLNYLKFYKSRFFRLYPLYILIFLVTLTLKLIFSNHIGLIFSSVNLTSKVLIIVTNLILVGQDVLLFLKSTNFDISIVTNLADSTKSFINLHTALVVPQAWSLSLEILFYILAPFVLKDIRRIVFFFSCSLLLKIFLIQFDFGLVDPWSYRFFAAELWLFLLGSLICKFKQYFSIQLRPVYPTLINILAFIFYFYFDFSGKDILLLLLFSLSLPYFFLFQNTNLFDKVIGELSYPIYISHLLVLVIVNRINLFNLKEDSLGFAIFCVTTILLTSFLLNKYFVARIEVYRQKYRS